MTIAITGATSMLGVATIKECIKHGVEVLAFCRKGSTKIDKIPKSNFVRVVECDLNELAGFQTDKQGGLEADVLIHFGWANTDKTGRNDPLKQFENVKFTLDAIHLAKRLGCKKFIGAGSQAEYGTPNTILTAKTPCEPLTAYGVAKFAAGKLATLECKKLCIECVWVRILSVFGTNDLPTSLVSLLIQHALSSESLSLSGCEQTWDYLFEEDAAQAFLKMALISTGDKLYNLASGKPRSLESFVEDVVSVINPHYKPRFGELSYNPTQPFFLTADISELSHDTGFEPKVAFKDGIETILSEIRKKQTNE